MKRTTTYLRTRLGDFSSYVTENWKFLTMGCLLLFGMVVGALVVRNASILESGSLKILVDGFSTERASQSAWSTFLHSFVAVLPFFGVSFLLGLCAAGVFLIPLIPFFRGLGLGATMGYLYTTHGWQGVAFCALLIIPPALLSSVALISACREALRFSISLCGQMLPHGKSQRMWPAFRRYLLRFLMLLFLLCVAAAVDMLFSASFSRFFAL